MAKRPKDNQEAEAARIAALSFEEAVGELESIVERIESGAIGLEASIDAYERGIRLRDRCNAILAQAEQRIDDLASASGQESSPRGEGTD